MERAERYAYKIYQTKSFSAAARELYISQPSLSATVKKLESELGFCIFDRSKTPITLTGEGEIYIEYLEEALENEKNMKQRIKSLSTISHEKLSVGGTNFLAHMLLPKACGEFHRRFPDVEVKIEMGGMGTRSNLLDKLEQEMLELVISYTCDETKFVCIPLLDEQFVIAVRKDFPSAEKLSSYALTRDEILSGKPFLNRKISDYSLFEDICFLRNSKNGSVWQHMSEFMEQCAISSCYVHNARRIDVHYDMMLEGMGAVVVGESVIAARPERSDEVFYFLINYPSTMRHANIIYKKDTRLSESAEEFIDIAREICSDKNKLFPGCYSHT